MGATVFVTVLLLWIAIWQSARHSPSYKDAVATAQGASARSEATVRALLMREGVH